MGEHHDWVKVGHKLSSILQPAVKKANAACKVVGTLGPQSRDIKTLEELLEAGMTVARLDFSWGSEAYHQQTLDNLKIACANTRKMCAVMLDTRGPEVMVNKPADKDIPLEADQLIELTTDETVPPSSSVLPVSYDGLPRVLKAGDTLFIGGYLATGSETSSVFLDVVETTATSVTCKCKNSATLSGSMLTVHLENISTQIPVLTQEDVSFICGWGKRNNIDFLSLSYTTCAADVREARRVLDLAGLRETHIMAKVESRAGLMNIQEIVDAADGIILSRGNLGIDLPPEKVFLVQKLVVGKCADKGKPVVITRVMDSMVDAPRPTRAEATDVANAVLDGCDGFLLGAETLRGQFPVDTVKVVLSIAQEAEAVFNQGRWQKGLNDRAGGKHIRYGHVESLASSAVQCAERVAASLIVVFTQTGRAARLVAKYRPGVPIMCVVVPRLFTDSLRWQFSGLAQARQALIVRGLMPTLADPKNSFASLHEAGGERVAGDMLGSVIHRAGRMGLISPGDRVVVVQRLGETAVVKIVDYSGTMALQQVYSNMEVVNMGMTPMSGSQSTLNGGSQSRLNMLPKVYSEEDLLAANKQSKSPNTATRERQESMHSAGFESYLAAAPAGAGLSSPSMSPSAVSPSFRREQLREQRERERNAAGRE